MTDSTEYLVHLNMWAISLLYSEKTFLPLLCNTVYILYIMNQESYRQQFIEITGNVQQNWSRAPHAYAYLRAELTEGLYL